LRKHSTLLAEKRSELTLLAEKRPELPEICVSGQNLPYFICDYASYWKTMAKIAVLRGVFCP